MVEDLSFIVNSLSVIVVAGSLVILVRQTREISRQTQELATQNKMLTDQLAIDSAIALQNSFSQISQAWLAYPELRQYFYEDEGVPSRPSGETSTRVEIVAEMLADTLETWVLIPEDNLVYREVSPGYAVYMREAFANSRALTDWVQRRRDWYHPAFVALADESATRRLASDAKSGDRRRSPASTS